MAHYTSISKPRTIRGYWFPSQALGKGVSSQFPLGSILKLSSTHRHWDFSPLSLMDQQYFLQSHLVTFRLISSLDQTSMWPL